MENFLSIPIQKFSINSVENDDRIAVLSMDIMHDGENLNSSEISLDSIKIALEDSLTSVTGIPILASFNPRNTDFQEHNEDEIAIGFIPQINNNLHYKLNEENNKTYVCVDGYIWRYYSKNSIDILEKANDSTKSCSIEIEVLEGHEDKENKVYVIDKFKFLGVTILGSSYSPGMENAKVQLQYSQTNEYVNRLQDLAKELNQYFSNTQQDNKNNKIEFGSKESIKIRLTKDFVDKETDWNQVDKEELKKHIMDAKNYKACVNACYLIIEDEYEDSIEKKLQCPVCFISNNELILSTNGCKEALLFLEQNKEASYYTSAKSKLNRYFKKLDISIDDMDISNKITEKEDEDMSFKKEEFALKFGLTAGQMFDELYKICCDAETYIDEYWECECSRYGMRDFDDQYIYCSDWKNSQMVRFAYSMEGDNPSISFDSPERVRVQYVLWSGSEDTNADMDNDMMDDMDEFVQKEKEQIKEKMSLKKQLEEKDVEITNCNTKYSQLEETIQNKDSEIDRLQKFEKETLNKETQSKADKLYEKYKDYITEDDKESLNNKLFSYEKFEDFEDKVKAVIQPKMEAKMFALQQNTNNNPLGDIAINLMGALPIDDKKTNKDKSSLEKLAEFVES